MVSFKEETKSFLRGLINGRYSDVAKQAGITRAPSNTQEARTMARTLDSIANNAGTDLARRAQGFARILRNIAGAA